MLTGYKDTDKIVLPNLNDWDLVNMCRTNKHFNEICKDDSFWRNRTLARFGPFLGNVKEIMKYMIARKIPTWKGYYIYLIDFLEKVYDGRISVDSSKGKNDKNNKEDIDILKKIINKNNSILTGNIEKYLYENEDFNVADICNFLENELNKDMLNPNVLFEYLWAEGVAESYELILRCMFKSQDKRIRCTYKNNILLREIADNDNFFETDQKGESFKLIVNEPRIDPNILLKKNLGILPEYLPILANSRRIRSFLYPILLSRLLKASNENDEKDEEKYEGKSFEEFVNIKINSILSQLE